MLATIQRLLLISSFFLHEAQLTQPLQQVWIGKIFADTMWTFAPGSTEGECSRQGQIYSEHLRNNTLWAVRMLDASVVSPSGLLDGDLMQMGHADQCTQTKVPIPHFSTQFCMPSATFHPRRSDERYQEFFKNGTRDWPPYDMSSTVWDFVRPRDEFIRRDRLQFSWGICVPEVCSAQDIQISLDKALAEAFAPHGIEFQVKLDPIMCYSANEVDAQKMPLLGRLWISSLLILIFLMIIGTTLDYQQRNRRQALDQQTGKPKAVERSDDSWLVAFSFISNMQRLSKMSTDEISIIHGVKFIGMCFVMVYHRELFSMGYAQNLDFTEKVIHDSSYFFLNASSQLLDTFFFLAGFLLAWILIQLQEQNKPVSFLSVVFYRLFRIYPMYVAAISFRLWVQPFLAQGPRWKTYSNSAAQACQLYWWHNLLFISNLFDSTVLCTPVSWFLSADFQMFLISLAIIFLAQKYPRHRTIILVTSFAVSHAVPSIVIYLMKERSFFRLSIRGMQYIASDPYFRKFYVKTYMRSPPYIFGVCGAYVARALMKTKIRFPGPVKVGLFFAFIILQLIVFYVGAKFLSPDYEYNVWQHVVYALVMRFTYACGMLVLMIVHLCGGYGAVTSFLSHPLFVVLGRLTFHMFFIHINVIPGDMFTSQNSSYVNWYNFFLKICGDVLFTTLLSLLSTLLLESPVSVLKKRLQTRTGGTDREKPKAKSS